MSQDLANIINRVTNLYENGHRMSQEQLNRAIDGITGQALQMVRTRRQTLIPPPPPPPRVQPVARNPLVDLVARNIGPYTAPLRFAPMGHCLVENKKVISKAQLEAVCPDSCPICLEKHKKKDTLLTDCGHEYGSECYKSWFIAHNTCPTCRKESPTVTTFKARASKKLTGPMSAPMAVPTRPIIIEDDDIDISHMAATIDDF